MLNNTHIVSLYVHIPFCSQACYYCDFHFSTNLSQKEILVHSICKEIELRSLNQKISSLYFGGGTPSILEPEELKLIFQTIQKNFELQENIEITLEANPNDLTDTKLALFQEVGINRLSIGVQTFHDPHLQLLNRNHKAQDSFACLQRCRQAGFEKFTLDLIYGIPAPSHEIWKKDMQFAVEMGVNHISAYALTIEQKTVFGNLVNKGRMQMPDEDFQAEQMELLMEFLPSQGFEQYEISNFAKNGAYSHHNTHYWKKGAYIGVGPSAHSYNGQARQWNVNNNARYIKEIQQGNLPAETEILSPKDHKNEYLLTSLRTKWGCDIAIFQNSQPHLIILQKLAKQDLILIKNSLAYLTDKGKLLADAITEQLLFS